MSEEFFMGVPPRALRAALSQKPNEPYSEDAAIMSLMLDIDINNVKPVRAYARIWNWSHATARYRFSSLMETANVWLSWNGKKNSTATAQQQHSRDTKGTRKSNKKAPEQHSNSTATAQQQHTTRQYSDTDTEKDSLTSFESGARKQKSKFIKPDLVNEVIPYFLDQSSTELEARKWFDHFESNGWKVGGRTTMKDWKASARNWIRNIPSFQRNGKRGDTPETRTITTADGKTIRIRPIQDAR